MVVAVVAIALVPALCGAEPVLPSSSDPCCPGGTLGATTVSGVTARPFTVSVPPEAVEYERVEMLGSGLLAAADERDGGLSSLVVPLRV